MERAPTLIVHESVSFTRHLTRIGENSSSPADFEIPGAKGRDELTYVFYKDGLETFVIRPGFSGKVEDFGMLISFPTPPALRKVSEDIFPQIAKAIDPPEVVIDLRWRGFAFNGAPLGTSGAA